MTTIDTIRAVLPGYICTVTRFVARVVSIALLQILGWTMSDATQANLRANTDLVYAPSTGILDTVLLFLFRAALDSPVRVYSEAANNAPAALRTILDHLKYSGDAAPHNPPCFLQSSIAWNTSVPTASSRYLTFNYTTHVAEYNTTYEGFNVPLRTPNVLTSPFNWKTTVFGVLYIYFGLWVSVWYCPVFFVLWMMWRNNVLVVNQPAADTVVVSVATPSRMIPADIPANSRMIGTVNHTCTGTIIRGTIIRNVNDAIAGTINNAGCMFDCSNVINAPSSVPVTEEESTVPMSVLKQRRGGYEPEPCEILHENLSADLE
jgi:hypothetical protein